MTLRKAGWSATPPVSVSPWISTWTRAAASRSRNCSPLRAAIPGKVPSGDGRSSSVGAAVHRPARADELADRHRAGGRVARRRARGAGLGAAGRGFRGRGSGRVPLLRRPPGAVGRQDGGGAPAATGRARVHHGLGGGGPGRAPGGGRAPAADRVPG